MILHVRPHLRAAISRASARRVFIDNERLLG